MNHNLLIDTVYSALADINSYYAHNDPFYVYRALAKVDAIIKEINNEGG